MKTYNSISGRKVKESYATHKYNIAKILSADKSPKSSFDMVKSQRLPSILQ